MKFTPFNAEQVFKFNTYTGPFGWISSRGEEQKKSFPFFFEKKFRAFFLTFFLSLSFFFLLRPELITRTLCQTSERKVAPARTYIKVV